MSEKYQSLFIDSICNLIWYIITQVYDYVLDGLVMHCSTGMHCYTRIDNKPFCKIILIATLSIYESHETAGTKVFRIGACYEGQTGSIWFTFGIFRSIVTISSKPNPAVSMLQCSIHANIIPIRPLYFMRQEVIL